MTSPWILFNSELICPKPLSAVEIICSAIWLLLMAELTLVISDCNAVEAIMPDGSSAPELIRKPVLKRVNEVCNSWLDVANEFCANRELTFVLIRVMPDTSPLKDCAQAGPDSRGVESPGLARLRSARHTRRHGPCMPTMLNWKKREFRNTLAWWSLAHRDGCDGWKTRCAHLQWHLRCVIGLAK